MFNLFAIIGISGLLLLIGTINVIVWTKTPDTDDAYNSAINPSIKQVIAINLTTGAVVGIIMYIYM